MLFGLPHITCLLKSLERSREEPFPPQTMSKFLTVKEVAEILSVSERTVRNLCNRGELPHVNIGTVLRIDETDLQNFIKTNKKEIKNND